jgi:hypothetical protein
MAENQVVLLDLLEREPWFPARLRPKIDYVRAATLANVGWWSLRVAQDPRAARQAYRHALAWWPRMILRPRTIIGLALTLLPGRLIASVEAIVRRLRPGETNLHYKSDYS